MTFFLLEILDTISGDAADIGSKGFFTCDTLKLHT